MKHAHLKQAAIINFSAKQRGASLLEGIAYLGIAALVILGAVSLLTGAFSSAQSNRGTEEVVSIRTSVKKLYAGASGAYGTLDLTESLNLAKIFPSTLAYDSTAKTMVNAWGGAVTVKGDTKTFIINYANVPQDVCIAMVSGASGWTSVTDGKTAVPAFPATPAAAAATCSSNPVVSLSFASY
jgi:hypothetical protein